ncbi:MAG TPA: hypothetical protein VM364_18830 [Vicinamibacterales bacterium]|nr:hypothetical protein [Vicinamibacterales bacterium]
MKSPMLMALLSAVVLVSLAMVAPGGWSARWRDAAPDSRDDVRRRLFELLQPVTVAGCELERFGEPHDGGYLMCGNLLGDVEAAYSYGISGYDGWGCDISRRLGAPVHQYDCYDTRQPACPGGETIFHPVCVAGSSRTRDGRLFEPMQKQIADNGHTGRRLAIKMDVEGSEWETLLAYPEDLLRDIDQFAIEFHGTDDERFVRAVEKLKRHFHVAHLHFNNYACVQTAAPFPSWAYEVLFVNKRLAPVVEGARPRMPHPLDAPNDPGAVECPPPGHSS